MITIARGRAFNGSGSIARHKGRKKEYQVLFSFCGRRKSGGYYATYEEACAALRELTCEIDRDEYVEPSKMLLSEWLEIWVNE